MPTPRPARFVALRDLLGRLRPDVDASVIAAGRVIVDGRILTNPAARVRADAALRVLPERRLRGEIKLGHALDALSAPVAGRVALDIGASAGGFSTALLARGARRVYAVDAGVGQLVGRLRSDPRVVNLEGRNLGSIDDRLIPETVEFVTMDLSYLSIVEALPQLATLHLDARADLVVLVKPTFELRRASLAASDEDVAEAVARVSGALGAHGWAEIGRCPAPATGRNHAREVFVHARRWAQAGSGPSCRP